MTFYEASDYDPCDQVVNLRAAKAVEQHVSAMLQLASSGTEAEMVQLLQKAHTKLPKFATCQVLSVCWIA